MRLLIVEDDVQLGSGLQTVLHQRGHTVDWVQDGIAANQWPSLPVRGSD